MEDLFPNIYWLCGSSRAGKTTISNQLKDEYGFRLYHLDDELFGRLWPAKANKKDHPYISQVMAFEQNYDLFYRRPVETILQETHEAFQESWGLLLEDILKLPKDEKILIEGGCIYPEWVHELIRPERIVFMIPSRSFQKEIFISGMKLEPGELPKTERQLFTLYPDPAFLVEMRVEHHDRIARHIEASANEHSYKVLHVDNKEDFEKNYQEVKRHFSL